MMTTPHDPPRGEWRTSSRSSGNGQCVEVASALSAVAVRDSKAPDAGHLAFSPEAWATFVADVRGGRFDLLS